jgi:hypothetical protein
MELKLSKSPPLIPTFCQRNPVHTLTCCYRKIHFNIILPYTCLVCLLQIFLLIFCQCFLPHATCLGHLIFLYVWWRVKIMKLLISNVLSSYSLPLKSKYSPWPSVLKHSQSLALPLMRETNFHTHTERQVTYSLVYLMFTFLNKRREDKRFWTEFSLLFICRIWGSHGGEYEDGCLLGCSAV